MRERETAERKRDEERDLEENDEERKRCRKE